MNGLILNNLLFAAEPVQTSSTYSHAPENVLATQSRPIARLGSISCTRVQVAVAKRPKSFCPGAVMLTDIHILHRPASCTGCTPPKRAHHGSGWTQNDCVLWPWRHDLMTTGDSQLAATLPRTWQWVQALPSNVMTHYQDQAALTFFPPCCTIKCRSSVMQRRVHLVKPYSVVQMPNRTRWGGGEELMTATIVAPATFALGDHMT